MTCTKTYRAGMDIVSTTVKLVLISKEERVLFEDDMRHHAHTPQTAADRLVTVTWEE